MTSTFFLRMCLAALVSATAFWFCYLLIISARIIDNIGLERKARISRRLRSLRGNLWLYMLDSAELLGFVIFVLSVVVGFTLMSTRP
jgi:hypothetical protein